MKQEAKAAYTKGKALMDRNDFAGAAEAFKKADELVPGAAPKYQVAVCLDRLGSAKEAIEAYRTFINSQPGEKYADRVVAAGKRIAELEKMLKTPVTLNITPAGLPGMVVKVDGNPVEGNSVELEAGKHMIEVSAPDHEPFSQEVDVAGEPLDLAVTLKPKEAMPPPPPPEEEDGSGTPGMGLRIAGYTTFGVAVAAGVVTGVFGVMALGSASDFKDAPSEQLADDTEQQGLIADVFLGVAGAAAVATGILLYFGYTADDGGDEMSAAVPKITPYAGPTGGGAGLSWKF
ncbi:MAG: hypothetical protein R3B72_04525 [Polyangiaceae bacterium]